MENEIRKPLGNSVPSLWWQYRMKHQYHYTPWDQWESMDEVFPPHLKGKYLGNKNLELKYIKTGKIWKPEDYSINHEGYPFTTLGNRNKEKTFTFLPSKRFSEKFLFNPEPKIRTIVDHADRDRGNLNLYDFRFLTPSENSKNKNNPSHRSWAYEVFSKYDKELKYPLTILYYIDLSEKDKRNIRTSIRKNKTSKGFRYKFVDLDVREYESLFGPPHEGEWNSETKRGWKDTEDPTVRANTNGYFLKDGRLTIGNAKSRYKTSDITKSYRYLTYNGVNTPCHEIQVKTFHGDIPDGFDIDHLKGVKCRNAIEDLKVCTHEENMNNEYTKHGEISISMINPDSGIVESTFKSIVSAAKEVGCLPSDIGECAFGRLNLVVGKLWAHKGKEKERWEEFQKVINDPKRNKPAGWWDKEERVLSKAKEYSKYKDFRLSERGLYEIIRKRPEILEKVKALFKKK